VKSTDISEILSKISAFVGESPDDLAVTVAARSGDPFKVLVSTILSLRTRDEVTAIATPRLLAEAPTPQAMVALSEERIAKLIYPTSFHNMKARYIRNIAQELLNNYGGKVPDTIEGLILLKGIGRKSANLILSLGFGKSYICVDTHVHRLSNRLGFVETSTPVQTELTLMSVLPKRWWIPINGLLIVFGRQHCTPISPKCSTCPVSNLCPRNGVVKHR
jgi:endonuclease-3